MEKGTSTLNTNLPSNFPIVAFEIDNSFRTFRFYSDENIRGHLVLDRLDAWQRAKKVERRRERELREKEKEGK